MILSCQNICKAFGEEVILQNISFTVEDHEKTAIVGINGAGKSTLLKIIEGSLKADDGSVFISKGKTLGYLSQMQESVGNKTVYDTVLESKKEILEMEARIAEMESNMTSVPESEMEGYLERYHKLLDTFDANNGYMYKSEVVGVLKGLGFAEHDFGKFCDKLSGGQKTRVALACMLISSPDIILLDEPTNHLDIESIVWLETYLSNYKGAVIIVAHDRYFLDRIVTKVVEISRHTSTVYAGNYTEYALKAAKAREDALKAYCNQQKVIEHQKAVIEKLQSFNREKSIKRAESRIKQLDKIEVLEKPTEENSKMKLTITPHITSGNDVLEVEGLSKAFGSNRLFEDIGFDIKRGEKIAIIGQNGTGKTTILKIINNMLESDSGTVKFGTNVEVGYFDQEHKQLSPDKTIMDEIGDAYPDLTNTRIRNVLAAFLFTGDDVFKLVGELSGGEQGRVALAKLMLSNANLLILDEPTNHLDIDSKEILEAALNNYEGTVLYVSHDRYFINKTATGILNLVNGKLIKYIGNYDYYLEKKEVQEKAVFNTEVVNESAFAANSDSSKSNEGALNFKQQKELNAQKRKLSNRIKKLEEQIEHIETRLSEIDELFMDPEIAVNSARLVELHQEQTELTEIQQNLYEEWEEVSIVLDELN